MSPAHPSKRRTHLPPGIVRSPNGRYRVWKWVPDPKPKGRMKSKRFAADTTIAAMLKWQADTRDAADAPKPLAETPDLPVGFVADVATYLETVKAMPSIEDRRRDMRAWLLRLGDIPRSAITSQHVRAARDEWLVHGPKLMPRKDPLTGKQVWTAVKAPLSASAVNHRLRALENFFTVMDGLHARNPVRDVDECQEPDPEPRDQPYAVVRAILAALPDQARPVKGGAIEPGSLTKVRCEVMAWQGIRPAQLKRVKPHHLLWKLRAVQIQRTRKGPRQQATTLAPKLVHMTSESYEAWKRFDALNAYGPFSHSSLYKSFQRAVRAVNAQRKQDRRPPLGHIRPYDLRHTFLTYMADATDVQTAGEFATHSKGALTARYARRAVARRQARSAAAFDQLVGGETLPGKPTTAKKRRKSA
jgi:integrase